MAEQFVNGMSAAALTGASWRKSARSGANGNCVEFAQLAPDLYGVRNSRHPEGPALIYTRDEMVAFIAGAKDGEFDDVLN